MLRGAPLLIVATHLDSMTARVMSANDGLTRRELVRETQYNEPLVKFVHRSGSLISELRIRAYT